MGETDLDFYVEKKLKKKLDRIVTRLTKSTPKNDALLIVEGREGEGKTNTSCAVAYYVKYLTNRPISLFFRLEELINFAKTTENQIIIWDEPSLDALSTDSLTKINKNLVRLLMTCRKKRHFLIFNLTKFHKFQEYVVVDRPVGFIHMYVRTNHDTGNEMYGHYLYIRYKNLERLYQGYKKSGKRLYRPLKHHFGWIPEIMERNNGEWFKHMDITVNGVSHCSLTMYNKEKDKAIESIGEDEKDSNKDKLALKMFKYKISKLKTPIKNMEELATQLGTTDRTILRWKNQVFNGETLEKAVFEPDDDSI